MNQNLPNGSVIKTKDSNDILIIIGQLKVDNDYDYICVKYPYGFLEIEDFHYVKRKDVVSLVCLGDINY